MPASALKRAFLSEFDVIVVGVVAALEADHQTAGLGVEAAQGAGGLQLDPGVGELGQGGVDEGLGGDLAEAVGDAQLHPIPEAPLLHHLQQHGGGLLCTSGLVDGGDLTALGIAADPDADDAGQLGHGGVDPAVPGQVGQGLQAEEDVGVVVVLADLLDDGVEVQALVGQLRDLLDDEDLLGTGGQGIEDVGPLAGVNSVETS